MSKQILTCADLKQMGIIESEQESGGVACCPDCEQGTHEDGDENFPHVVITPKRKRVDFCCMCYDYVPVSALVGQERANAWLDEALEAIKTRKG